MKKIIITNPTKWTGKDGYLSVVWEDNRAISMSLSSKANDSMLGNIYVGKVKNIVNNIQCAFLEIMPGVRGYLPLANGDKKKIRIGDERMVQVIRENVKSKQPTLSLDISLTGQSVVLLSSKNNISISSKIKDVEKRKMLESMATEIRGENSAGCIIRTNAANLPLEEVRQEIEGLYLQMDEISRKAAIQKPMNIIYKEIPTYLYDVRDCNQTELSEIVTDVREVYEELCARGYQARFYEDDYPIWQAYGLEKQVERARNQKVWLTSGGTLVIETTEACTVIDVNTGKAIDGKRRAEETFFKINKQAAEEIARQVQLRNLSGIIIIDFIDMQEEENRNALLEHLRECVRKDTVRCVVVDMTPLGLVEMTRKKVRKPLAEQWAACAQQQEEE